VMVTAMGKVPASWGALLGPARSQDSLILVLEMNLLYKLAKVCTGSIGLGLTY